MKRKRIISLLLIVTVTLSLITPASAATYTAATWLSPKASVWANDAKRFSSTQNYGAQPYKEIFTYREEGVLKNVVYCLSPQSRRVSGDILTDFSDSYISDTWWNEVLSVSGNNPGTSRRITELLSYLLYFGYSGQISAHTTLTEEDMTQAAILKAFDEALATQVLVWELIVGERNADFTKRSPASGYDAVLDLVKTSMPGYSDYFLPMYTRIESSVQRMLKTPSFLTETAETASRRKLSWDGSQYTLTLQDTNDCLEFWEFSGNGLRFSKEGNQLIITAERLPDAGDIQVTASGTIHSKSMIVQASSGSYHWDDAQPTVIPGINLSADRSGYLKVYGDPSGSLTLTKESSDPGMTDGNSSYTLAGICYKVYTDISCGAPATDTGGNEAVLTVQADGTANILTMFPGTYYVKEYSVPAGCGYLPDPVAVKAVSVTPGKTASVRFLDEPLDDPAGVVISKTNENGQIVPGADLSGARYEIKFYAGQYTRTNLPSAADAVWTIETKNKGGLFLARLADEFKVSGDNAKYGTHSNGSYVIPLGTLTIREVLAPSGFKIEGSTMQLAGGNGSDAADGTILVNIIDQNSAVFVKSGNQTADSSEGFEILQKEKSIPVTVNVKKINASGSPIPGVVFNLKYADADGVVRDHQVISDANGNVQWTGITYGIEGTLYEVSAPAGYKVDPAAAAGITRALTGTLDNSGEFYLCSFGSITNEDDGGKVTVRKTSNGPTLAGFTFRISGTSALGAVIDKTAITNTNGIADFGFIPSGTYTVAEIDTPVYMSVSPSSQAVTVASTDIQVSFTNTLKTGTVNVTKAVPSGSNASLAGFTFRLSGTSDAGTSVNLTATTDASGKASFTDVPYGTYDMKEELTSGQAKIWKNKDKGQVTVSAAAVTVSYTLDNEPLTGTVSITKAVPSGSNASPAGFVFRLSGTSAIGTSVNLTATTDASGKAAFTDVPYGTYDIKEELTAEQARIWKGKDREQVTVNTEQDTVTYTLINEEITIPVKVVKTSDNDAAEGFTFTLTGTRAIGGPFTARATTDTEGKADFGEVPYGIYTVTEAPDPIYVNNGPWTFTLNADSESPYTIHAHNSRVTIGTRAEDSETHIGVSEADDNVVINDIVHYYNLVPGTIYTLVGTIMDAETEDPFQDASGNIVTVAKEYEAEAKEGSFIMTFEVNAEGFAGKKLVVFEELYLGEDLLAEHKDFGDDMQTVYLPQVTTNAKDDNTQINHAELSSEVSITDTVNYTNLRPGKEYVVNGVLMDKISGKPLLNGEDEITAEAAFTPEKADGTVELTFTFDASVLGGTPVVVFETVYYNDVEVAVHADMDDEDQTVYIPEISTTATADNTDDHVGKAADSMTITDIVAYKGLEAGREYTVKGILMDKATGRALTLDGKEVTSEITFTAEASEGEVELTFTFDASLLAGTAVVAFETLCTEEKEVAVHADIGDEDQTVYIPGISTDAADKDTGTNHAEAGKITIIDTVTYQNLLPGKEYKLQGVLMNKATNEPIKVNGEKVTAEVNFTPEKADGTIDLEFTFDASAIAGTTVVVFESVCYDKIEVAVHADIDDEAQTIYIPVIGTTATAKDTGSHVTAADEDVTIVDVVTYKGLKAGQEYTVQGVLMDKATNKALLVNGKGVTAEATFTAGKADGTIELEFTFSAAGLEGNIVVAFETLYTEGKEVAVHADIEDEDQSVQFPGIRTTIKDKVTGIDHTEAGKNVTVIDTVHYTGLIPGKEYTLKGFLVNKATAKELGITAEKTFTPEKANGNIDIAFTFDAFLLAGTTVVAFETLYSDGIEVAAHANINDKEQTEYIPKITTDAMDKETGLDHAEAAEKVTIIDLVNYKGLKLGQEYTVKGVLMDKATGKALLADGKEITAEKSFKAEKADGAVVLEFTFDGTLVAGKTAVIFETLYTEEKEVAIHADIEDEDQTVYLPGIQTTAVIKDGDKIGRAGKEITVVDRVDYKLITCKDLLYETCCNDP